MRVTAAATGVVVEVGGLNQGDKTYDGEPEESAK